MLLLLACVAAPDSSVGIAAFTAIAVRPADTVHAVIWTPSSSAPGDTGSGSSRRALRTMEVSRRQARGIRWC